MAKAKFEFTSSAETVWAAAARAMKLNGACVKQVNDDTPTGQTNRQLVIDMICSRHEFSPEELQVGEEMRNHFKAYSLKLLCDKKLNAWEKSAFDAAMCDEIDSAYYFGVICALPQTFYRERRRASAESRIQFARGGYLGDIGQTVSASGEVLKLVFSTQWLTFYATIITQDDKVVFFPIRDMQVKNIKVGDFITIEGKVKNVRENSTHLSRVKVI